MRSQEGNAVRTWHTPSSCTNRSSRSGSKMAEWWGPERALRHSRQSFSGPNQCVECCEFRFVFASRNRRKEERKRDASYFFFPFAPTSIEGSSQSDFRRSIDRSIAREKGRSRRPSLPWEKKTSRWSPTKSARCSCAA